MSQESEKVGLCFGCRHVRVVTTARGGSFYLCQLSASDPSFAKYPQLPVMHCRGYRAMAEEADASGADE